MKGKKIIFVLSLVILVLFLTPDFIYWGALDRFKTPLRYISGDTSMYVSHLNSVLTQGKPAGNPYFIENKYQIGRFSTFGTIFSLIPFASKISIIEWMIIFKIAVVLLTFFLFSRILILFNIPRRLAYLFSFIFVLFYGATTFKGGYAVYNWYLPGFLASMLFIIRFYKSETVKTGTFLLSLFSLLFFSFHPVYFAVGVSLTGLFWLYILFRKPSAVTMGFFLV